MDNNDNNPSKTGPKPKQLVEATIVGLCVGRDNIVVPPDQVEELAAIGCTDRDIANFYGVKEDTLRRNFAENLVKGREGLKIKLRRAMLKNALVNMNTTMQIWLSKQYLAMQDNPVDSVGNEPLPWTDDDEATAEAELNDLESKDDE